MVIETKYLVGEWESIEETIRYHLSHNWDESQSKDITPKFISPQGLDSGGVRDRPLTARDWVKYEKTNLIRVESAGRNPRDLENSTGSRRYGTVIRIDVFAKSSGDVELFMKHIDEIFLATYPTSTRRINKSDGKASAIHVFGDPPSVQWSEPMTYDKEGTSHMASGEIECIWQQNQT